MPATLAWFVFDPALSLFTINLTSMYSDRSWIGSPADKFTQSAQA